MEIFPERLLFPRNFRFFHKLPARFEIHVVGKGARTAQGVVFELELAGQRLALPSRADLKIGARYELEKISGMEFRIVREIGEEKLPANEPVRTTEKLMAQDLPAFNHWQNLPVQLSDLIAIKLAGEGHGVERTATNKYAFDFGDSFRLQGVFVASQPGSYSLFLSGHAANPETVTELTGALADLGVTAVRFVSADVFERIRAGSVDLES